MNTKSYAQLSWSQKKLYAVHIRLLSDRKDHEVMEMAQNLRRFPHLSDAVRAAVAKAVRDRKLAV